MQEASTLPTWRQFHELGLSTIPIRPGSKRPALAHWRPYQFRLPTAQELHRWFSVQHTNFAVLCGGDPQLVVLDFDTLPAYVHWRSLYAQLPHAVHEMLQQTYIVQTARGRHVYLFVERSVLSTRFSGGEVQSRGKYVLIPPSVHPSGAVYRAISGTPHTIAQVMDLAMVLPELCGVGDGAFQVGNTPQVPPRRVRPTSQLDFPLTDVARLEELLPLLPLFPDAKPSGGGFYSAHCPLHEDHHPSLWINPQLALCKCYAGCNNSRAMNVVQLLALKEHVSYGTELRRLVLRYLPAE